MMASLLLLAIVSCSWLGSASAEPECTGSDRSSVVIVPSSGPTVCLSLDDYIQLQKDAASDGESTDAPPPTSVSSTQGVSSSALLLYRYMSPLWLQTHANFAETPSSVSAQTIEFGSGPTPNGVLFKVKLIEAGVLDDDKAYSIQIAFFFTHIGDSDPNIQICDGSYCAGFQYWDPNGVVVFDGIDSVIQCGGTVNSNTVTAPQSSTTNWNIRLEIHPNSTSGITYVSTTSLTYEYNQKLKPNQGLHLKVCRGGTPQTFQFHLFELALYSNK